jgi:hypothetical protein
MKALEVVRERAHVLAETPDEHVSAETPDADVSAETPSVGARAADALVLLAEESLAAAQAEMRQGGDRYQVVVHVDADALRELDGGRAEVDGGEPLAAETARRICCDASLIPLLERAGKPLSVGRKTRAIPTALRRALRSRDHGCRFPGCSQHRWVDAHHIEHWAHGGDTSMDNLVQLCRHHHRLVHEGGFSVERRAGNFVFRRPDGRALATGAGTRGDATCIIRDNRRRARHVTPETCVPHWYGDRLRLADAVEAVLRFAPPART